VFTPEALAAVEARIAAACARAGRPRHDVGLIAVSKTFPVSDIVAAQAAGQVDFGENRGQDLRDKAAVITDVRWHYIGALQVNKAKYVAPVAYRVHALESLEQAEALARRAPARLQALLAVNVGEEPQKSGVFPAEALDLARALTAQGAVDLVGLMCIPPATETPEQAAPYFATLAQLAAEGRRVGLPLVELSMGMSADYEVAIAHGATWVRVGSALFGGR